MKDHMYVSAKTVNPLLLISADEIELSINSLKTKLMMVISNYVTTNFTGQPQEKAAEALRTNQMQISHIMRGNISKISIELLLRLAGRLGHVFETRFDPDSETPIEIQDRKKKARSILHVTIGAEGWEPSLEEMEFMQTLVENAVLDPLGAVLVTRTGVGIGIAGRQEADGLELVKIELNKAQVSDLKAVRPTDSIEDYDEVCKNIVTNDGITGTYDNRTFKFVEGVWVWVV